MKHFPIFINMEHKAVLVVGAGAVATRRILALLPFGADITVVAPSVSTGIERLAADGRVIVCRRRFAESDAAGVDIVFAATDDTRANDAAEEAARKYGCLFNRADKKERCDFYFPALVQCDPFLIGICSDGQRPAETKQFCRTLRKQICNRHNDEF